MAWYDGVADSNFDVDCEGQRHTICWSNGEILLTHHPDVQAEKTLVALGGRKPRCLEIFELWEFAISDGGFIEEWAPWHEADHQRRWWLKTALERLRSEGVQDFLFDLSRERAVRMGEVVTTLPHEFLDRAMATVVDAGDRRGWDFAPAISRHLFDATKLRARRSFVRALSHQRPAIPNPALLPFVCHVDLSRESAVEGQIAGRDSRIEIRLHPRWLSEVWARGLAVHCGRFTVSISEELGNVTLTQVEWVEGHKRFEPRLTRIQL